MVAHRVDRPPLTILVAMGIAIGGAAVSSSLDLWLSLTYPTYLGLLEPLFSIFNLALVVLNLWLLVGIWRHSEWAWGAALALVVMGAVLDAGGVALSYFELGNLGGFIYLGRMLAPAVDWNGVTLLSSWIHLIVIQVPILVLLQLAPSRRWVGIDSAAPANS